MKKCDNCGIYRLFQTFNLSLLISQNMVKHGAFVEEMM